MPALATTRTRRRLHQLIIILYVLSVLGSVSMVVGPFLNDRTMSGDPGRALATVTNVSPVRTTVDFEDDAGILYSPPTGLLYPTGLGEGQQVWVTYHRANPDLVKVEGRTWTLSIIPALSVLVVATLIAIVVWWVVNRGERRAFKKAQAQTASPEVHGTLSSAQPDRPTGAQG